MTPATLPLRRPVWPIVLVGLLPLAAAMLWGLAWGSQRVDLAAALRGGAGNVDALIVWHHRLPRVLMAALTGAVLALAGALLQALLRNPLASPFTLGIAGGGALGAFLAIFFEGSALGAALTGAVAEWSRAGLRAAGAFAGVFLSVGFVFAVARLAGGVQTVTLLLAGVTLNFICGAAVMLIQLLSDATQTMGMVRWSMGGIAVTRAQLAPTATLVALGALAVLPALRHLDVLSVDDRTAHHLGVAVRRVRAQIILGTAVMVGACLAVAGPIGFVGLIAPHACRLVVGPGHRRLLPAAVLAGAAFLVVADTLGRGLPSRLLGSAGEIPVGVLTAACGGPVFLAMLIGMGRRGRWGGGV